MLEKVPLQGHCTISIHFVDVAYVRVTCYGHVAYKALPNAYVRVSYVGFPYSRVSYVCLAPVRLVYANVSYVRVATLRLAPVRLAPSVLPMPMSVLPTSVLRHLRNQQVLISAKAMRCKHA